MGNKTISPSYGGVVTDDIQANGFALGAVPSGASSTNNSAAYYFMFDLKGLKVQSITVSLTVRHSYRFSDSVTALSVQTQADAKDTAASGSRYIDTDQAETYVSAGSHNGNDVVGYNGNSVTETFQYTINNDEFLKGAVPNDHYYVLQVGFATGTIGGGSITSTISGTPKLTVTYEGDDSGGGGGTTTPTVTATPSSPNGVVSENDVLTFKWSISKSPSSTVVGGSELQYRTANGGWMTLASTTGSANSCVPNVDFEAGQSYIWRVRSKANNGDWGDWSGEISFTVKPSSTSDGEGTVTASPSSPSSSVTANKVVDFRWSISKSSSSTTVSGTEIQYRIAGSSGDFETLASISGSANSYTYETGFSAGDTVIWRVRSANGDGEWGAWSGTISFEVKAGSDNSSSGGGGTAISTTIATPKSGTKDGSQEIIFAYELNSEGTITGSEAQYSLDEGVNWRELTSSNGSETAIQYTAPALMFPAGTVQWRARGRNESKTGNWATASFAVEYAAHGVLSVTQGVTSGYLNAAADNSFAASMGQDGTTPTPITPVSAELRWRVGTTGDWCSVVMSCADSTVGCVVPAGTFPVRTLQWYISAVDSTGSEVTTDVFTVTALKSQIDAVPARPVNTVELAAEDMLFQWRWYAVGDTQYSKAELQFSDDGILWYGTQIVSGGAGALRETTVPADSFDPGTIYWRVRAYDENDAAGEWSDTAEFLAYGVEVATNIQADSRPFSLIQWRSEDQIAYSVRIDEEIIYGPYFGEDRSFILPEYLEDGTHRAEVRIQNSMELWSDWAGTFFVVANDISESFDLSAAGGIDAALHWMPESAAEGDLFYVYRDGSRIAELDSDAVRYTDRTVLGTHIYKVIQRKTTRYYRLFGTAQASMESRITRIALLEGGNWLDLKKTTESRGSQRFSRSKNVQWTNIMGARYPVPEIGEYEELYGSYQAAWSYDRIDEARRFEAMFGKAVIVKSRGDRVVIGILEKYDVQQLKFAISYSFTLQQMEYLEN